jgi:UDP-N-acetylglucosamine transferase subunit ALG13
MILVTVGSMMPFDRLVAAMDEWASSRVTEQTFAQIGGGKPPNHMRWARTVALPEFADLIAKSTIIVAHAGMGSIISAAEAGKPIVIMPRYASLKEHTTDHQVHTAARLRGHTGIYVAISEAELPERIEEARSSAGSWHQRLRRTAPETFVARIRAVLLQGTSPLQLNGG